jgi:hypothetical protein
VQIKANNWYIAELKHYGLKESTLVLSLPTKKPDVIVPVIELILKDRVP